MTKTELTAGGGIKPTKTIAADHAAPDRHACQTNSPSSELAMDFTDPRKNLKTMLLLNELMGTLLLQLMIEQEVR